MSKRNYYLNVRSEYLMHTIKERGYDSASDFINQSICNSLLPCYSQTLRVEAFYLLDLLTDNDINIAGKTIAHTEKELIRDAVIKALGRAVMWLAKNHISTPEPLKSIFKHFPLGSYSDYVESFNEWYSMPLYDYAKSKIESFAQKDFGDDLGAMAQFILEHWHDFYSDDRTYEFLSLVIYSERLSNDYEPRDTFYVLQTIEVAAIWENIKS